MIRRPRRTVPATLVALVILAAAVLVVITCIQVIAGRAPLIPFATIAGFAEDTAWNDPVSLVVGAGLAGIGLVLLVCALLPGRSRVVPLTEDDENTQTAVTRRSLAHDLAEHVRRADGITSAGVTVGARAVRVTARTPLRDGSSIVDGVREQVETRLDDIAPDRRPRVSVAVRPDRSLR